MKFIVLGGAGDMGSRAAEDLASSEGVERVTVADRNVQAAGELVARLAGKGAEVDFKAIDADDHGGLVEAMRGYDVAASALGPFYLFEEKLVRAALEAGVHYCSICDEFEAADAVIDNFHEQARSKDITVITGLGTSPGLTNVAVRYAADKMDKVRRADIYVYQPLEGGGGPAVVKHMLHILVGEKVVWRGGKRRMIRALSEERVVRFPKFGEMKTWNMGHSEPATVPRFIPGVEEVNFFMGFGPGAGIFVKPARWGLFNNARIADFIGKIIAFIESKTVREPQWGAVRVDVWGEKDGEEVHRVLCGVGQMREATGLSLSVGAQMVAKKRILAEKGGVYAPEAAIDPLTFINMIRKRGIEAYDDIEMTVPVGDRFSGE